MKKRLSFTFSLFFVLNLSLPLFAFHANAETAPFKGSGTRTDPYVIATSNDLIRLADLVNTEETNADYSKAYYEQTQDIDLVNISWTPIGEFYNEQGQKTAMSFEGVYNGKYHTIRNLSCSMSSSYSGLFGRLYSGNPNDFASCSITNLCVIGNVTSSSGGNVGGIVGELALGAGIKNCCFIGDVSGAYNVGGLVGQIWGGGSIESCYHNGSVTATDSNNAGGIVGKISIGTNSSVVSADAQVLKSYHTGGTVMATNGNAGGIVGLVSKTENASERTIRFSRNYYLLSSCNTDIGDYSEYTDSEYFYAGKRFSEDALRQVFEPGNLGDPFVKNEEESGFNDGYPIFKWQAMPYQFKGSGTQSDPYLISSKTELIKMRDLINDDVFSEKYNSCYYAQTADIDLKYETWIPIGIRLVDGKEAGRSFFGSYDGRHHEVRNLFVLRDEDYAGLFGAMDGNGVIESLTVSGEINSIGNSTGGIVGRVSNGGIVKNCAFIGNVTGAGDGTGGVVGYLWTNGTVDGCYSIGTVVNNGGHNAGGIIGHAYAGNYQATNVYVKNCYHVGMVSGLEGKTGSVVGLAEDLEKTAGNVYITNCFALKGDAPATCTGSPTQCGISPVPSDLLKTAYEDLGEPFIQAENDEINNGYPIFSWQHSKVIKGDINNDGALDRIDVILLKSWLLGASGVKLENWKAADFHEDGKLDAADLTLMKRAIILSDERKEIPESIELNKTSAALDLEGKNNSIQLIATVLPSTLSDQSVKWESSNTSVASVTKDGLVKALSSGSVAIVARSNLNGKPAVCRIIVEKPSVSISKSSVSLYIAGTETLTASAIPSTAQVTWNSDKPSVATVNAGKITALAAGVANITATITVNGTTYTSSGCKVTVISPSIKLDKTSVSPYIGGTETLTATVVPSGTTVNWSSSDAKIATVSGGKITAVAAGTATITAKITVNGIDYPATCKVTVVSPSIKLNKSSTTLYLAGKETLTATVIPSGSAVTWSSSDTKVATVNGGTIFAVAEGNATITAKITVFDKNYSATCKVTIATPSIKLNKTSTSLYIGQTETLTATVVPSGTTVNWASSDAKIATVSGGKITAVAAGTATITAKITVNGIDYPATCKVTVVSPSIKLNKTSTTLYVSQTESLIATVAPSGTSVTWSSDANIAKVDSSGKITAVAEGYTTITAKMTVYGKNYSATCGVTVKKPKITVSKASLSIFIGDSSTISATVEPSGTAVSWKSSNTNVATVSSGKISAIGAGSATITATMTVYGTSYSASCSVTVNTPKVTLSSPSGNSSDEHVYYSTSTGGYYAGIFNLPTVTCTPNGTATWSIVSGNATVKDSKLLINQPGKIVARASFTYQGKTYSADYTYDRTVMFSAGSSFALRSGPSTSTSSLATIPKGTVLTVASLDYSDGTYVWGKVTYNGKTGYVALWRKDRKDSSTGIINV